MAAPLELEFRNVGVDYPQAGAGALHALSNLSLHVAPGEPVAIIGPSGCGKSTLLRLAAGLASPTQGTVHAQGAPVSTPRQDTALILQDFGLLPWATVYRNAELGCKIHKLPRAQREERTKAALETVGLSAFASSYPGQLSGGMQQRLALARALAMDVGLLLMDEPLSALDALLREELQEVLLQLWKSKGCTMVLVTHSIEEAVFLGKRIVVMAPRPGRVVNVVDNPGMGSAGYRSEGSFFSVCTQVRSALAEGARQAGGPGIGEVAP